jgi:hypothetical protein
MWHHQGDSKTVSKGRYDLLSLGDMSARCTSCSAARDEEPSITPLLLLCPRPTYILGAHGALMQFEGLTGRRAHPLALFVPHIVAEVSPGSTAQHNTAQQQLQDLFVLTPSP